MAADGGHAQFDNIKASCKDGVAELRLISTSKRNALGQKLRDEIQQCISLMAADPEVRCVILTAEGNTFCSGIDLQELGTIGGDGSVKMDTGRTAMLLGHYIEQFQDFISCLERCPKPIIAAIHGPCIGAGVDLTTACDIRLCTQAAVFSVREARVGLAADVGTLQRLPKVVGCISWVRDLAFTGRDFGADEALRFGFVQDVLPTVDELHAKAWEMARAIAANSPLAVAATKVSLNYSRDHSVAEGLEHIRLLNQSYLQAPDPGLAVKAFLQKQRPAFPALPRLRSSL